MAFHTPARLGALPAALELGGVRLPRAVPAAVRSSATPASRSPRWPAARGELVDTDRGDAARAAGGRRAGLAPRARPAAATSRPRRRCRAGSRCTPTAAASDLDVWIDRSLVRHGYGWSVPAGAEQRVGVGSYEPRDHVKEPTVELAARLGRPAVRYQGNWFPHRLRRAAEDGVFFVGDSAGHCFPLSGEGIRTAFYFGIACGRELRAVLAGERSREQALRRYAAFSASHRRAFGLALRLQWLIPRAAAAAAHAGLRAFGRGRSWTAPSAGTSTRRRRLGLRRRAGRRSRPRWARSRARRATRCRSGACPRSAAPARGPCRERVLHPRRHLGEVWRSTMPCSSSARRRSDSVRGLIPASERSSSQKRLRALGEVADHEDRPLAADDVRGRTDGAARIRTRCPV